MPSLCWVCFFFVLFNIIFQVGEIFSTHLWTVVAPVIADNRTVCPKKQLLLLQSELGFL